MILQALYDYYTAMAAKGKMAKAGWNPAKVQFALLIDEKGTLLDILRLKEKGYRGKKEVDVSIVVIGTPKEWKVSRRYFTPTFFFSHVSAVQWLQ